MERIKGNFYGALNPFLMVDIWNWWDSHLNRCGTRTSTEVSSCDAQPQLLDWTGAVLQKDPCLSVLQV